MSRITTAERQVHYGVLKEGWELAIRVLIVDDNNFVRMTVAALLAQAEGITVVGECSDGAEVVNAAASLLPDVVLMDVQMAVMSGIDATRALKQQQSPARVLILSAHMNATAVAEAARAGAVGYLRKGGDAQTLVAAIRVVGAGGTAWPDELTSTVELMARTSAS
jgi:DNA-binding NarL/FixJ family response regulator